MADLSTRVQDIASIFYKTRSDKAFTQFYNTLLPEAEKIFRTYIKDPQTVEDLCSKVFETILVKPSIYFDEPTQQQFIEIAAGFFGIKPDQVEFLRQEEIVPLVTRNTLDSNISVTNTKITNNANPFYDLNRSKKIKVEVCYTPKEGVEARFHPNEEISLAVMGKMWLLINKPESYRAFIGDKDNRIEVGLNKDNLASFELSHLASANAPFIFSLDKPFLHYFSRIIKTNALSYLKKSKRQHEQMYVDMYAGFDDDDKPQLWANRLTDEPEKIEIEQNESQHALDKQKFMIVFDIINNTVPENQRGIIIDAILLKMDYKQICAKHHLETVGCVKSRVHRFKKRLDQDIAKTLHFTSKVELGVYTTYYSGGQVRMRVEVCESFVDNVMHSQYHGSFVTYYTTGEVKEIGRYSFGKRQGNYYQFHKDGSIMKRGQYQQDNRVEVWHHFDPDGKLNSLLNYVNDYYEVVQEDIEVKQKDGTVKIEKGGVVSGYKGSDILPVKDKTSTFEDDTRASKLCLQYDCELSYPSVHSEI